MIQENMALYLQQLYKFKETGKFSQFVKTPRQKKKKKAAPGWFLYSLGLSSNY